MFTRILLKIKKNIITLDIQNLKEISFDKFLHLIKSKLKQENIEYEDYYLIFNNTKILNKNNFRELKNDNEINIICRQRGGLIAGMVAAVASISALFAILTEPMMALVKTFGILGKIIGEMVKIIPPLFEIIALIFNPKKF